MDKRILYALGGLVTFILVLAGIKALQIGKLISGEQNYTMPPVTVTTATAKVAWWETTVTTVGSLSAFNGVNVPAELPGKVLKVVFKPGSKVNAGDLLLIQDTSSEDAQLRAAMAATDLAHINLTRNQELLNKKMISQAEFDASSARYKEAIAHTDNINAIINKKKIRAPFAGQLGTRLISPGQNLKEGEAIVSLQSMNPMLVNFLIPQRHLASIIQGLPVRVTTDAYPEIVFEGEITAVNSEVDEATRNIKVQATIKNNEEKLVPGMFVDITGVLPKQKDVLTIPSTSVLYAAYGNSVFIVDRAQQENSNEETLILRQQFVRLGENEGDYIAVENGLNEGEIVVTSGVFKLRNGQAVVVDNTLSPEFTPNPNPQDS